MTTRTLPAPMRETGVMVTTNPADHPSGRRILELARGLDDVVELAPQEGSEVPPIAWGDHFFTHTPDPDAPPAQPFLTLVTKDYPDEVGSDLDGPGRWRVNVQVGRRRFVELLGVEPRGEEERDFTEADVLLPHPVYRAQGWIAVVTPGERTLDTVLALITEAHADAVRRAERRRGAETD